MSSPAQPPGGMSRPFLLALIGISAINPLGINMFVPAIPDMIRSLGTDLASIQLVLSVYLFATAVAQLFYGPLSDWFGRRPVLFGGLATFVVASLACTFAPSIDSLIVARAVQGAGGCVGVVLGRAIIRDRFEQDRAASALGYLTMGFAIAPMVGPSIGGLLNDHVGWPSIFALQAGLGVLVLVAAVLLLPETRPQGGGRGPGFLTGVRTIVAVPAFWGYAFTLFFGMGVFFAFLSGTPTIASDMYGLSATTVGLYYAFIPGGFIIGSFLTARYSPRFGILFMMAAGCVIIILSVVAMGILMAVGWHHPLALFGPMYGVGLANGLAFANAIAGAVSLRPAYAGAASGLASSIQVTGGAIATVVIGAVLNANPSVSVLVGCMLAMAVAALAAAIWARIAPG